MKLNLYSISDKYIQYLRSFDSRVYDNKEERRIHTRKYLGVVFKIRNFNYYAPVSSPKNSDMIIKNANVLYKQKEEKREIKYLKNTVNFKFLEEKSLEYINLKDY